MSERIRFGTDGVRGVAGRWPVDPAGAAQVGRAALALAREAGSDRVLIARDTRPSGLELAIGCLAGVRAGGGVAVDLGVVPTAALAVALAAGEGGAGVMITASHNPWPDNGFKILGTGGRKPDASTTERLEAWMAGSPEGQADRPGAVEDGHARARDRWLAALVAGVDLQRLAGRRIALDLAEGAALSGLEGLRAAAPVDWVLVRGPRINDGVGSEHPEALAQTVLQHGCDAGIAVDGDADRCVLVDERGQVVDGDGLAWLLARALGVDRMAVTVMSNGALGPALPGVQLTVTPVGDKHLQAAMAAEGIPLGCEESGHVLFADHPGGDGLLAGLRALASVEGELSSALAGFVPWPRVKAKLTVGARPPLAEVLPLQQAIVAGQAALGPGGRVFLRYSGTEPVLRVLVEGREAGVVAQVAAQVEAVAREVLG